jgi:hypothetical protein
VRKRDREFIRELMHEQRLISDHRFSQVLREMDKSRQEMDKSREEMRKQFAEQREKLDEIIAEGKAGRAALFAILDRLGNGGAPATG